VYSPYSLVLAWVVLVAAYVAGWCTSIVALVLLPHFAAPVLAVACFWRARWAGRSLQRPWWYRLALGLLLACATVVVATAGSTVVVMGEDHSRVPGLIVMASTNLLVIVLGWRALTRPAARRAALVGVVAVTIEPIALLTDVALNMWGPVPEAHLRYVIAMWGAIGATGLGALVSIAAITAFGYQANDPLPAARVIGEGAPNQMSR
jgi:hypothetical protein